MLSIVERLEKVRDLALDKMNEIIGKATKSEGVAETEAQTVKEVADLFEPPFTGEEEEEEVAPAAAKAEKKEATPPEPAGTGPREVAHKGDDGKVSKSKLIREFFAKHPEASNKQLIQHYERKGIEIKPALVSTVKINMGTVTKKKRGRPAKAESGRTVASAKRMVSKRGLPMPACITKVVSKSRSGMRVNEILKHVKKYYVYGGKKGDDGLKNVINQALYALSSKKPHRGWKGDVPVILHDEESHTWKLNPRAERKTA